MDAYIVPAWVVCSWEKTSFVNKISANGKNRSCVVLGQIPDWPMT